MRGFGPAAIIAHDPYVPQTTASCFWRAAVSLEELLTESDYVSIHTSLTEETRHLINTDTLKVNEANLDVVTLRADPVIDGNALASALKSGTIRAAALTTLKSSRSNLATLLSLSNVIVTPHTLLVLPNFAQGMSDSVSGKYHSGDRF